MLKNIMYGAVILAALAFGYRQLFPPQPEVKTETEDHEDAKMQMEKTKVDQVGKDAELARDNQIESLLNKHDGLYKQLSALQTYLGKDKKRIFRKIPHDSLPIYGAQMETFQQDMHEIDLQLEKLGYKFGTGKERSGEIPKVQF